MILSKYIIKNNYQEEKENMIRRIMLNQYGIEDYNIEYTDNGKPYFKELDVHFNISNENDILLLAFDEKPIGCDIISKERTVTKSIKDYLNLEDKSDLELLDEFSKREAIIKLEGLTIQDINNINVDDYEINSIFDKNYFINIAQHKS